MDRWANKYMRRAVHEHVDMDGRVCDNVKMMGAPYGTLRIEKEGGVQKGEELRLDYGEDYWESEERQRLLKRLWAEGLQSPS